MDRNGHANREEVHSQRLYCVDCELTLKMYSGLLFFFFFFFSVDELSLSLSLSQALLKIL